MNEMVFFIARFVAYASIVCNYRSLRQLTTALLLAAMLSFASSQATSGFNNLQSTADVGGPALQLIEDMKYLVNQVRSASVDVQQFTEDFVRQSALEFCNTSRSVSKG